MTMSPPTLSRAARRSSFPTAWRSATIGVVLVTRDSDKWKQRPFAVIRSSRRLRSRSGTASRATAQDDVARRDFTINGLLMRHDTNEVLDFVGGQLDLQAGIIRAIGDPERRFTEDKLRMLRAVRFAARFGYTINQRPSPPFSFTPPNSIRSRRSVFMMS